MGGWCEGEGGGEGEAEAPLLIEHSKNVLVYSSTKFRVFS